MHKDLALGSNAKRVKILGASLFNVLELTHCLSHAQISIPENQNITLVFDVLLVNTPEYYFLQKQNMSSLIQRDEGENIEILISWFHVCTN